MTVEQDRSVHTAGQNHAHTDRTRDAVEFRDGRRDAIGCVLTVVQSYQSTLNRKLAETGDPVHEQLLSWWMSESHSESRLAAQLERLSPPSSGHEKERPRYRTQRTRIEIAGQSAIGPLESRSP
ncbi:hypothetical protein C446_06200 [Halobiforma nitratireducens JCM 10879]|uniref:Uncharacterized protein n=1 Tax=Halobiforma nitratireducens JCM 10879 TaxID=1227454 RepID=M0M604_9EURY|nr:hypothetical protein C446_06200 [Halobiforma nitratireducens JCM 10879]